MDVKKIQARTIRTLREQLEALEDENQELKRRNYVDVEDVPLPGFTANESRVVLYMATRSVVSYDNILEASGDRAQAPSQARYYISHIRPKLKGITEIKTLYGKGAYEVQDPKALRAWIEQQHKAMEIAA